MNDNFETKLNAVDDMFALTTIYHYAEIAETETEMIDKTRSFLKEKATTELNSKELELEIKFAINSLKMLYSYDKLDVKHFLALYVKH